VTLKRRRIGADLMTTMRKKTDVDLTEEKGLPGSRKVRIQLYSGKKGEPNCHKG